MRFTLRDVTLVDGGGERAGTALTVEGAQIAEAGAGGGAGGGGGGGGAGTALTVEGAQIAEAGAEEAHGASVAGAGAIVTPGLIDVHTHGGGGFNLHTTDAAEIAGYARWAPTTGTTAFLAGVVGVPDG